MFLTIKNIGKVKKAEIEIAGITIIAGENDTGKSTLGRVLFCVFNSFYDIDKQIDMERKQQIGRILESTYHDSTNRLARRFSMNNFTEYILKESTSFINNEGALRSKIVEFFIRSDENFEKHTDNELVNKAIDRIVQILSISKNEVFNTIFQKKMDSEFNSQINNIFSINQEGTIDLTIQNRKVTISLKEDKVQKITNDFSLKTEIVYIDDPFALDAFSGRTIYRHNYDDHKEHLISSLVPKKVTQNVQIAFEEIFTTRKIEKIYEKINLVCEGEIVQDTQYEYSYKKSNAAKPFDIKNISAGLKTFIIIKTLLQNGVIEENGTIILDEPEIHLHPEWQLLFAELIVLLQKEFSMHILLNTHSPYFLNAIEVYSAKYEIADKCRYYLAENQGNQAEIFDVTSNIDKIYKKLARPLQKLENMRYTDKV